MRQQRVLSLSSTILAGFLAGGFATVAAEEAESLNPMKKVGRAALKSFLERPLFDPHRRLPAVATAPTRTQATNADEPPPQLRLLGVIHGVRDMAIVQRSGEKATITLRNGDHVGNWIATVMPPVGIRLRNGNRAFDYALFSNLTVSAGPVMAGPAAPGGLDAVGMPEVMPTDWGISLD